MTGGLGGFGQRLLPYLVSAGARHLTLMDRDPRAPPQRILAPPVHDAHGHREGGSRSIWSRATLRWKRTCAAASPT